MESGYCRDCRKQTEQVLDHATGDSICTECGLVLESRYIDDRAEWRNFADSTDDYDPNRVGGPVDPLLTGGGLTTVISGTAGKGGRGGGASVLNRAASRCSDPDRELIAAFQTISIMCDRLSLVATIKDTAKEMYKMLEEQKCAKGKSLDSLAAGCIFVACRHEGKTRTVKEICTIANGATKKEIGRVTDMINRHFNVKMDSSREKTRTSDAEDYLRRFCSNLGMGRREFRAVQEAVQKSKEFDIRRSPVTIAAVVIYMITQLSDVKKRLRDISEVTTVAENTIKNGYKDLYIHASKIVPDWFSKGKDLNKLLRA